MTSELPDITAVKRLHLQPGEILVITCPHQLLATHAVKIKQMVEAQLRGASVLILDSGMDIVALDPATAQVRTPAAG